MRRTPKKKPERNSSAPKKQTGMFQLFDLKEVRAEEQEAEEKARALEREEAARKTAALKERMARMESAYTTGRTGSTAAPERPTDRPQRETVSDRPKDRPQREAVSDRPAVQPQRTAASERLSAEKHTRRTAVSADTGMKRRRPTAAQEPAARRKPAVQEPETAFSRPSAQSAAAPVRRPAAKPQLQNTAADRPVRRRTSAPTLPKAQPDPRNTAVLNKTLDSSRNFSSVFNAAQKIQTETSAKRSAPKASLDGMEAFMAEMETAKKREAEEKRQREIERARRQELERARQQEAALAKMREEEALKRRQEEERMQKEQELRRQNEEAAAKWRAEEAARVRAEADKMRERQIIRLREAEAERVKQREIEKIREAQITKVREEEEEKIRQELARWQKEEQEHAKIESMLEQQASDFEAEGAVLHEAEQAELLNRKRQEEESRPVEEAAEKEPDPLEDIVFELPEEASAEALETPSDENEKTAFSAKDLKPLDIERLLAEAEYKETDSSESEDDSEFSEDDESEDDSELSYDDESEDDEFEDDDTLSYDDESGDDGTDSDEDGEEAHFTDQELFDEEMDDEDDFDEEIAFPSKRNSAKKNGSKAFILPSFGEIMEAEKPKEKRKARIPSFMEEPDQRPDTPEEEINATEISADTGTRKEAAAEAGVYDRPNVHQAAFDELSEETEAENSLHDFPEMETDSENTTGLIPEDSSLQAVNEEQKTAFEETSMSDESAESSEETSDQKESEESSKEISAQKLSVKSFGKTFLRRKRTKGSEETAGHKAQEMPEETAGHKNKAKEQPAEEIPVEKPAPKKHFTRKKYDSMLGKIVAASLAAVMALNIIIPDKESSVLENRELKQAPQLKLSSVLDGSFSDGVESWQSDQFIGRNALRNLQIFLRWAGGDREENDVYFGKGGQLLEKIVKPEEELLQANLSALNAFAEKYPDKRYGMMLVPDAGTILKDRYPAFAEKSDQRGDFEKVKNLLSEKYLWIDGVSALEPHTDEKLYYKTDHHWTSLGAHYGYQKFCETFGLQSTTFTVNPITDTFNGALSSTSGFCLGEKETIEMYSPESQVRSLVTYTEDGRQTATLYDTEKLKTKDQYAVFLGGNYPVVDIKTTTDTDRVLLLFKDSFANCMIPMLADQYKEIVMVDPRYYYGDIQEIMLTYGVSDVVFLYSGNTFFADHNLQGVLGQEQA